jgi:hypothetical protein
MLTNLTYQKKCMVLAGAFLLFLLAGYQLSFSKTMALRHENAGKEKKIAWLREKEKEIPFLRSKMALVEKVYASSDSASLRDKLTAFISDFAVNNRCTVTEIPRHSTFHNGNISVETNIFTVEGHFTDLLSLEYEVESRFRILARIMSARFYSAKDLQTKHKSLYLTLITQSFNQSSPIPPDNHRDGLKNK